VTARPSICSMKRAARSCPFSWSLCPSRDGRLEGTTISYRGHKYLTREWKGYRTVAWRDDHATFGLVSMLDNDAILECAERLRVERAAHNRL
jgi:hypothetical protein